MKLLWIYCIFTKLFYLWSVLFFPHILLLGLLYYVLRGTTKLFWLHYSVWFKVFYYLASVFVYHRSDLTAQLSLLLFKLSVNWPLKHRYEQILQFSKAPTQWIIRFYENPGIERHQKRDKHTNFKAFRRFKVCKPL